MSELRTFDEWWFEFQNNHLKDKDGGFEISRELHSIIESFEQQKRFAFIDELIIREELHTFACDLIPEFGNQDQKDDIRKLASMLIDESSSDFILGNYVDVIIETYNPLDLELLRLYYLGTSEDLNFRIPVKLYDLNKDLFLEAFSVQLKGLTTESITKFDGLLYLTDRIDALKYLIENSEDEIASKLKSFTLAKSKHSMVALKPGLKDKLLELAK